MKRVLENHWITGLALLAVVFLLATGVGMMATGGEFHEAEVRVYGVVGFTGGLALSGGLWGLRAGRLKRGVAHALIVAGLVVLGAGFWWFVFLPPLVALAVIYAGVVKGGLARELQPS